LQHWATEYAINVGISLEAAADAASARVRILPSPGRPPLTLQWSTFPARTGASAS